MEAYQSFAQVYDQMMDDMPYDEWLSFTHDIIKTNNGHHPITIVDLGCGTGRIAIALAQSGHHVTGIDLSDKMLERARQAERLSNEANKHEVSVTPIHWLQQNMVVWETAKQPDLVISYCDSINYLLNEDEILALFYRTYDNLKPGGLFVFDCHPISRFEQYAQEQPFAYDDGEFSYIWFSQYDDEDAIIEHELTIYAKEEDGRFRRIDETHVQRAYSVKWLEQALMEVGFSSVNIYADFKFEHATEEASRLFFVVKK